MYPQRQKPDEHPFPADVKAATAAATAADCGRPHIQNVIRGFFRWSNLYVF